MLRLYSDGEDRNMAKEPKAIGSSNYEKGMLILDKMLGEGKNQYIEMLDNLHEGLGNDITEQIFGKWYSREVFDLKTRQLITIALLLSNGDKDQILFHTQCALNLGVSKEQIIELILQSTTIIGIPKALMALKTVKQLFDS